MGDCDPDGTAPDIAFIRDKAGQEVLVLAGCLAVSERDAE